MPGGPQECVAMELEDTVSWVLCSNLALLHRGKGLVWCRWGNRGTEADRATRLGKESPSGIQGEAPILQCQENGKSQI